MAQSAKAEAQRWAACFDELAEPEQATALAIRDLVRQVVRERAPQAKEAVKWGYAAWVLGAKERRQHVQHHGREQVTSGSSSSAAPSSTTPPPRSKARAKPCATSRSTAISRYPKRPCARL